MVLALGFFILAVLAACGESGADETGAWWTFSESYNNQSISVRLPEGEIALLLCRMRWVWQENGERIPKGRNGLFERDPVLAIIGCGFRRIPFELVGHSKNLTLQVRS